jgi:hypothetical protein
MNNSKTALLKANNTARSNFKMKFYNCGARLSYRQINRIYISASRNNTLYEVNSLLQ